MKVARLRVTEYPLEASVCANPSRENVGPIDLPNFSRNLNILGHFYFKVLVYLDMDYKTVYIPERTGEVSAYSFQFTMRYR